MNWRVTLPVSTRMRTGAMLSVACTLIGLASVCQAEPVRWGGEEVAGISVFTNDEPAKPGELVTIFVSATAQLGFGPRYDVHVQVPDGVKLESGDTTFSSETGRMIRPRRIELRVPESDGEYEIRATLVIPGRELIEVSVPLLREKGQVTLGGTDMRRSESIIDGRAYRRSGWWLIPTDPGVAFDIVEFARLGRKPSIETSTVARCSKCVVPDTVAFLVVVDRSGTMIQSRALSRGGGGRRPLNGDAVDAAQVALGEMRFRPAQFRGRAITDWSIVSIPVGLSD